MEKPTEEEVQQFMNKSPQSPAAKCFGACVYEKSGAVSSIFISLSRVPVNDFNNTFDFVIELTDTRWKN